MLWSLIKIVIFVALVAALTLGAGYLMESEGGVEITVAGTEYVLGPLQSVIAALLLVVAVWIFLKLFSLLIATLRFINGDETAISRYFDRNRERKGYQALGDGLLALAAGEGRVAMAKAEKADRYLSKPELTDLITAQAAEMTGDTAKAEKVYKRMVTRDETRFIGVRGIMKQRLAKGDTDTALKLAERAFAIKPKHEELQDTLLKLQAEHHDWGGARKTLSAKLKYGSLPRDVHKRRDAILALSEASEILDETNSIEAREAAIEANRKSPDLIPAAAMAARGYIEKDQQRYATRVIKKAWQAQPHPDLAAAFAEIEPDETPEQRLKRFTVLTRMHPEHRETKLLQAELNIAAEDFPAARRALGDLPETDPDVRVLTIMAAVERGEGAKDAVVRGWLARALTAPRGPQWVCEACNNIQTQWTPICDNCHGLDTLSWTRPPHSEQVASGSGAEMLPLIVGAIEDQSQDPLDAVVPSDDSPRRNGSTATASAPEDAEVVEDTASDDDSAHMPDADVTDGVSAEKLREDANTK